MSIFINFEEPVENVEMPTDTVHDPRLEHLDRSVEELELSVRSYNCLKNANIQTIRELVQKSENEMLKTKNFGRKVPQRDQGYTREDGPRAGHEVR